MSLLTPAEEEALLEGTGGVPVVFGEESSWGHLDVFEVPVLQGNVETVATRRGVRVVASLVTAVEGQTITVNGTAEVVRDRRRVEDGVHAILLLGDAS